MRMEAVDGDPFAGLGIVLMPEDGDPFTNPAAANQGGANAQPPLGQPGAAPLDDFAPSPGQAAQAAPVLPGLASVASDPSWSMGVRVPAAIGSTVADQAAGFLRSAWGAATLPGDVATGKVDPNSLEAIRRSTDLAGLLTLPAADAGAVADPNALGVFASRSPRMYNPPTVSPRPFEVDYPVGAPSDAAGNLIADIEGRSLGASRIVGRSVVGGVDQGLSPTQSVAAATATIGQGPQAVASRQIAGDAGRLVRTIDPSTGSPEYHVFVDRGIAPDQRDRVVSHEFGHVIDELSGQIPDEGLSAELRSVYNTLNNPQSYGKPFGPENNGYKGSAVQRELMAEALRAYMADPNYLKSAAPKTAAAIRAAVNSNPRLSQTIQFNSGGLMGVPALFGEGQSYAEPQITLTPVQGNPFGESP